jgi:hypothetical protein
MVSKNVLADSAASVGLLIAFYYGLTGFACAWTFRRSLRAGGRELWVKGILPLLGGLLLFGAFVLSIKSYLPASSSSSSLAGVGGIFVIGAGALAVGVVIMILVRWWLPAFFTRSVRSSGSVDAPAEAVDAVEAAEAAGVVA